MFFSKEDLINVSFLFLFYSVQPSYLSARNKIITIKIEHVLSGMLYKYTEAKISSNPRFINALL